MNANSFYPLISKPTRITDQSATLIDNIFTNNLEKDLTSGLFYTHISDHLPLFQITNLKLITDMHPKPLNPHTSDNSIQHAEISFKAMGTDWNSIINAQ